MLVADLSQNYYGYSRQSAAPGQESEAGKPETRRPAVFPAERVVEGELLRSGNKRSGDTLNEALQRGRFVYGAADSGQTALSAQAAQRAVNTYLDNASLPAANGGGRSGAVDYYA